MNYSLWAIANRRATAITTLALFNFFLFFIFLAWYVVNDFQSMVCVRSDFE